MDGTETEHTFDLVIVGGSANGSQAAYAAIQQGISVAVIEEHPTTGLPEHCSGLFSYEGLELIDSIPPKEIVFNPEIYGARIVSPSGNILTVRKSEPHALVCDRAAFDRFTLQRAEASGVTLYQPYKALTVTRNDNGIRTTISNKSGDTLALQSKLLISAEGVRASIVEQLGMRGPPKDRYVNAAQYYMHDLNGVDSELVEVYQTHKFAPDYFAWLIPMSPTSAKIGLGTSRKHAAKELDKIVAQHPVLKERCEGADHTRTTAGRIPTTGPVKHTVSDRVMMVGDVAGQTKPTTGGGVIIGGIAAQIAGQVAAEAVKNNRYDAKFLKVYQSRWRKQILRNLKMMRLVREYMNQLEDVEVDAFFSKLEIKGITKDIEKYGHVDNQATLIRRFMTTWSLYPFYLKTSGRLLRSLLRAI